MALYMIGFISYGATIVFCVAIFPRLARNTPQARKLRDMDKRTIMINYNPETVSTDFDEADRLYFEELGWERVMDIYELEQASGVVVSVGGQLPQNIALRLKQSGVNVLGTATAMIDTAEDRHKFSSILDKVGVDQPEWTEVSSVDAAKEFANRVGYVDILLS